MRWRTACLAFFGCFAAAPVWAAAPLTTSVSNSSSPSLGKIVSGSGGTLTTFTITPAGAVSASGGNATRLLGTASVTTPTLNITCSGNGSGTNSCTKYSKITVTFGSVTSSGGRTGNITAFTGAIATGAATIATVNSTSFTINPTGGQFSNGQQVSVKIGMSVQFNNSGSGLGTATALSYAITYDAS